MRQVLLFLTIASIALTAPIAQAMEFTLQKDGHVQFLRGVGDIDNGAADRLIAALDDHHGVYIVELASDGGSVVEAMVIGMVLRNLNMTTFVADGDRCFSACFLAFIGGVDRYADPGAEIGVHQFTYADPGTSPDIAIATSQTLVAQVLGFARDMGVSAEAIERGLFVAPDEIYVYGRSELERFGIVSEMASADAETSVRSRADCPFPPTGTRTRVCDDHDCRVEPFELADPLDLYPECADQ